jgi:hypothetical protein
MCESPPDSTSQLLVVVRRDLYTWQATVADLGTVRARSLCTVDRRVRDLVGDAPMDYQFHTGDTELDRLVQQVRTARAQARWLDARARRLTNQALRLPVGGSGRDLG